MCVQGGGGSTARYRCMCQQIYQLSTCSNVWQLKAAVTTNSFILPCPVTQRHTTTSQPELDKFYFDILRMCSGREGHCLNQQWSLTEKEQEGGARDGYIAHAECWVHLQSAGYICFYACRMYLCFYTCKVFSGSNQI